MGAEVEVGRYLREARGTMGMTLEQVREASERLGHPISTTRLSQIERGLAELRASDIGAISTIYGHEIAAVISEVIASRGRPTFGHEREADDLFWEGKRLYDAGNPREAAWALDEAMMRYEDPELKSLALTCAAHCYMRIGADRLAQGRAELAVDISGPFGSSETNVKAAAEAMEIRTMTRSYGVASMQLAAVQSALETAKLSQDARAVVESKVAYTLYVLNKYEAASDTALAAARRFKRLRRPELIAQCLAKAGLYLSPVGPMTRSVRLCNDARSYLLEGDAPVEATIHVSLCTADVFALNGNDEEAKKLAMDACELANRHGYREEFAWSCHLLERLSLTEGNEEEAKDWRQKRAGAEPYPGFPAPREKEDEKGSVSGRGPTAGFDDERAR